MIFFKMRILLMFLPPSMTIFFQPIDAGIVRTSFWEFQYFLMNVLWKLRM